MLTDKVGELVKLVNTATFPPNLKINELILAIVSKVQQRLNLEKTDFREKSFSSKFPFTDILDELLLLHLKKDLKRNNYHFIPKLTHKYNARTEWLAPISSDSKQRYPHPYRFEIQNIKYPEFNIVEVIKSGPMGDSQYINRKSQVEKLLEDLKKVDEIAIDLEHHSDESYLGLTCLMQISTRSADYIVDTIELRDDLQILNEVFTDPKVTKVLHGAASDIIWLQRDLGLYIVNLFDSFHACKLLNFPKRSLSYLLKFYCNYNTDKSYQRADWRTRPLPAKMLSYAQSDTHFLLEIYDRLKNALIEKSLLKECLKQSESTSLTEFYIEEYDYENGLNCGWKSGLNKFTSKSRNVNFANIHLYKEIHYWRDRIARQVDVSPPYLISNWILENIAAGLPNSMIKLKACFKNKMSDSVKKHVDELFEVVLHASECQKYIKIDAEVPISNSIPTHTIFTSANVNVNPKAYQLKSDSSIKTIDFEHFKKITPSKVMDSIIEDYRSSTCNQEKSDLKKPNLSKIASGEPSMGALDDIISLNSEKDLKRKSETSLKTKIDPFSKLEVLDVKRQKTSNNKKSKRSKLISTNQVQIITEKDPNPIEINNKKPKIKKRKYMGKDEKQKIFKSK
eukprot:NODE_58_length_28395_cov_1.465720.p1 type:complete len:623 gc:universal NODE_58_length_28395_cov_1.465720:20016-21884(+)